MKLDTDLQAIEVLDTPRDQDQSPLLNLTARQKIAIAKVNDAFGIDYTEAGFPESNPADHDVYEYFRRHPDELKHTKLAAFGATRRATLGAEQDPGLAALLASGAPALVIVGKSSRQQAEAVLRVDATQNLEMIEDTFAYLQSEGVDDLSFDAEHFYDGYKLDPQYSLEALRRAMDAGVQRIVLCDTKGGSFPEEIYEITQETIRALGDKVTYGVHMHDDADMATANTLAGIRAGARHYQGTWLGYGERVANADHTKVLPNLWRKGYRAVPDLAQLNSTADDVAEILQVRIEPNAPFIGAHAFTHKAGQHVRGNQHDPMANQFMPAETVGNSSRSILSKQSGMGNIDEFLERSTALSPEMKEVLSRPKEKARMLALLKEKESNGMKYRDAEASFLLLALQQLKLFHPRFRVHAYKFLDSSDSGAQATLQLQINGDPDCEYHAGRSTHGTVDALKSAFLKALGGRMPEVRDLRLIDYEVHKIPSDAGTASEVQVVVEFSNGTENFYTTGVDEDVIAASGKAMTDAIHYCILAHETEKAFTT